MTEYADFSVYVATRWPRLVRTAILLGCSPAEAEDVTQAALEKCFVHWSKVEAADDRDAYVHRILINTFNSSRRQRRWRAEHSTDRLPTVAQPDHSSSVASSAALRAALMRLSPEQRAVVVLRYYAQLSESETARRSRFLPEPQRAALPVHWWLLPQIHTSQNREANNDTR